MNPQEQTQPNTGLNSSEPQKNQQEINNPLSVMESGERVICEVKRHPIGIFGIYLMSGVLLIVLAVLALIVAPSILSNTNRGSVMAIGGLIFIVVAAINLGFVFISNKVYWGNRWVVTSDSITQITQSSLFHKQSSQLSLGNLEDVTAEQNGPLAHMLNYGRLRVETAGERSKFMFPFCPNPNYYAKQILGAREAFEQDRGDQPFYRNQTTYQEQQQTNDQQPPPGTQSENESRPPS